MILGAGEIVVVLAVALMVLGPQKMPEVARTIARFLAQLRRVADEVKSQVEDALQDPPARPQPPTLTAHRAQTDAIDAAKEDGAAPHAHSAATETTPKDAP